MVMQRSASLFVLCGSLVAVMVFSAPATAIEVSDIVVAFQRTTNLGQILIERGYQVAPALMLGLVLLLVVPLIAVISPIVFHAGKTENATRRYRATAHDDVSQQITGGDAVLSSRAYLEIIGVANARFAIVRDMLRIGREDDNDIRIPSAAVHRYHAAIYREHLNDWHIADLSGRDGNGIRVNGQKCFDARLSDGDVIELGPGRLRFRAGYA